MSSHPFDNDFEITPEHKEQFRRDGFVKLEGFYNPEVVKALLARVEAEMDRGEAGGLKADSMFNRAKYDFKGERTAVYELLERPYLRWALRAGKSPASRLQFLRKDRNSHLNASNSPPGSDFLAKRLYLPL